MRTIKFRGKKYMSEKWCFGVPLIQNDNSIYLIDIVRKHGYHTTLIWPETLGEFTGECDFSGKEIYEGDVVKVRDDYDKFGMYAGETYEVVFAHGGFRLKPRYSSHDFGFEVEQGSDFTVIGNIYEKQEKEDVKTA